MELYGHAPHSGAEGYSLRQSPDEGQKMMEDAALLATVALGARVVDSVMGDLTGEGRADALLVIDPATTSAETPRRLEVVLMERDAKGQLRKVASNARLISCEPSGAAPDFIRTDPGSFTIVDPGSPNGAGAEYRFVYDRSGAAWMAEKVSRTVIDGKTSGPRKRDLTLREFGRVNFVDFDPEKLFLVADKSSR